MQLTVETAWYPTKRQQQVIQDQMSRYQNVKRISFKEIIKSQARQPIVTQIRQLNLLSNARYIRSAIEDAKAAIKAQRELIPLYCKESAWKVQQASQKLQKYQQTLVQKQKALSKKQYQKSIWRNLEELCSISLSIT
ncbi:MAG: hypothetical protein ACFFDT_33750 [Candidatus Hodarchaeota archaeon]